MLLHLLVERNGKPIYCKATPANQAEQDEAINLLRRIYKSKYRPIILQADKGYDSSRIRGYAASICGIIPVIPQRVWGNQVRTKEERNDRWKVERTFAWLYRKYRRLSTRWERKMIYYQGFVSAALCLFWLHEIVG